MIDDATFDLLNAVYLKKLVSIESLATLTESAIEAVDDAVLALAQKNLLVVTPAGVLLSDAGRAEVVEYYDGTYDQVRTDPGVVAWYERFETLNTAFIGLVSEWQRSEGDGAVQERLMQVVGRLIKALGELAGSVPRYANYLRRFSRSVGLVDLGDTQFVANPRLDSIHNIWFEFHEDILAVLGRPRDST